jgi:aldehyde reductase
MKLNSGYDMPIIGLGTWMSKPGEVGKAVIDAYNIGYRHFDCALVYGNEAEIGTTLSKLFSNGKAKREDLFITSKVWSTYHSYQKAGECIDITLRDLQVPYLDMYLIHWPMSFPEGGDLVPKDKAGNVISSDVDFLETWRAMEDAVTVGKIRSIGLSNFNISQIERIINSGQIKPSNLQIEIHPYLPQNDLIRYCQKNDIVVTAYSPLANNSNYYGRKHDSPNLLHEPDIVEIAQKHTKTPAQVAIRWALQRNTIVIPKSVTKNRIHENIDVFDFSLSEQEMQKIDNLDRNWRTCDLADESHPFYPFQSNFDCKV